MKKFPIFTTREYCDLPASTTTLVSCSCLSFCSSILSYFYEISKDSSSCILNREIKLKWDFFFTTLNKTNSGGMSPAALLRLYPGKTRKEKDNKQYSITCE